jgi:hypothetical protein
LCPSINHGINLEHQVSLQYLYYLDQVSFWNHAVSGVNSNVSLIYKHYFVCRLDCHWVHCRITFYFARLDIPPFRSSFVEDWTLHSPPMILFCFTCQTTPCWKNIR